MNSAQGGGQVSHIRAIGQSTGISSSDHGSKNAILIRPF
jgi:hypothetical protein